MPQVKLSDQARIDLGRFADFLVQRGFPQKAEEAILTILSACELLQTSPLAYRKCPLEGYDDFHELIIRYGKSGYVALYSFDKQADLVVIHAIRHQKEVGYKLDGEDSSK
jgi:plasmid stabilization system protein ParE